MAGQEQQPAVGTVAPLEKGWAAAAAAAADRNAAAAAARGAQPRDSCPSIICRHTLPAHERTHVKYTLCADTSRERRKDFHRAYKYQPRSDTAGANVISPSTQLGEQRCAAEELGNPNRCVTK